jgi:hypothetical protein
VIESWTAIERRLFAVGRRELISPALLVRADEVIE